MRMWPFVGDPAVVFLRVITVSMVLGLAIAGVAYFALT